MVTDPRRSSGWRRWARQLVLDRGGHCERCGSRHRLQVHHLVALEHGGPLYPTAPDCPATGVTVLCVRCHSVAHADRLTPGRAAWLRLRDQQRRRLG